jgi:hypothetical protein
LEKVHRLLKDELSDIEIMHDTMRLFERRFRGSNLHVVNVDAHLLGADSGTFLAFVEETELISVRIQIEPLN